MGLKQFARKSVRRYRCHGPEVLPRVAAAGVTEGLSKLLPLHAYGRRVFNHEWDVLVVLNACRADMYRRVVNTGADVAWSCTSSSLEWMDKNFDGAYSADLTDTAYVTENPFTDDEGIRSRS